MHECDDCGEDTCVCDDYDDFDDEPPCGNHLAHDACDEVPCPDCGKLP